MNTFDKLNQNQGTHIRLRAFNPTHKYLDVIFQSSDSFTHSKCHW